MPMIHFNHDRTQIRVDTTIKIIDKDGTEITAPVVVLIGTGKVEEKHRFSIYKIANGLFHKEFILNRNKKEETPKKKPWFKFW
jgi:hypothetical protein